MSLYAVLLAGGSGTRLWPVSTSSRPKQFLPFNSQRTLLQATVDRLVPLISLQNVYVVTFPQYVPFVREQLPELSEKQLIIEPEGCGTAAGIGLAATLIMASDPQAVIGSFPADLLFLDGEQYRQALQFAEELAHQGYLVALGVEPIAPETGYGYIQVGESLEMKDEKSGLSAFRVLHFISKPPRERAEAYIREGTYMWHTGVFVWRADRILEEIRRYIPAVREVLDTVRNGFAQGYGPEIIPHAWNGLRADVPIEAGVVEKAHPIALVPLRMGWSDLGSWTQIAALYQADEYQKRLHMPCSGQHVAIDTHNTFVYSQTGKTIAIVGVENLIIVETDEALLICQKSHVQHISKIPDMLAREKQTLSEG